MSRTRANSVCLTKNWIKIIAFSNATPYEQILKQFVSGRTKSPKVNKNLLSSLTACLFKEIDAQIRLYIVYKSVLSVFTQEFSLVVWLYV